MHWLIHGTLAPAVADALTRHKQKPHTAALAGIPAIAAPAEVLNCARVQQWEVITNDARIATEPFTGPGQFNRTLVYLQLSGGEVEQDDAIDRLFTRYPRLVPGRLYTVTENRVKIRQLPTQPRAQASVDFENAILI